MFRITVADVNQVNVLVLDKLFIFLSLPFQVPKIRTRTQDNCTVAGRQGIRRKHDFNFCHARATEKLAEK